MLWRRASPRRSISEKDADLDTRVGVFLCPKSLAPQGFFHYVGCMERAFPPISWVQKASYVGFPLFRSSGWVHDKTAAGC